MFVKADHRIIKVFLSSIIFIEGLKEYIAIHTLEKKLVCLQNLKKMEEGRQPVPSLLRSQLGPIRDPGGRSHQRSPYPCHVTEPAGDTGSERMPAPSEEQTPPPQASPRIPFPVTGI